MRIALSFVAVLALAASCKTRKEPTPRKKDPAGSAAQVTAPAPAPVPAPPPPGPRPPEKPYAALSRADFNRWAVRQNLPVYWIADGNRNGQIDANEVAGLLFYPAPDPSTGAVTGPGDAPWVSDGTLTPAFDAAYRAIVDASKAPPPTGPDARRQQLVGEDLDQGSATLVRSDLIELSADDKVFVRRMLEVGRLVDDLYDRMRGSTALEGRLPPDAASRSLFRRNRGPRCVGPKTERDPACSAIPGVPKPIYDLYPAELQGDDTFCAALEKRPDAKTLMEDHFAVVRGSGGALRAVPYTVEYEGPMEGIAKELLAAADLVKDKSEAALAAYLRAAAASFQSNDWFRADEAWAKMNSANSKWYVRAAPDEVYWEPCARKAGLHLSFARINQASKAWQQKLLPVRQDMEQLIAQRAGAPYAARRVAFQLPDFIDIVINAGDDRSPLGATIGQSLPNWGPVVEGNRGRTVVMTNLYQDPDSLAARRSQAESMLDAASMTAYAGTADAGLLGTILHEAAHNLGPAHDYKVGGKTAGAVFTGPIASVMEELKAQTAALFLVEFLRAKKIISAELAAQSYADAIVWALGHTSQGMYSGSGDRKTYSQLAAIQLGYLLDKGALVWNAQAPAANGRDRGALTIRHDKLVPVVDDLMKLVAGIKARGDKAAALELIARYVDGAVVPHAVIKERFLRVPKPSFVYSVAM
jgi:hypothetical protein